MIRGVLALEQVFSLPYDYNHRIFRSLLCTADNDERFYSAASDSLGPVERTAQFMSPKGRMKNQETRQTCLRILAV